MYSSSATSSGDKVNYPLQDGTPFLGFTSPERKLKVIELEVNRNFTASLVKTSRTSGTGEPEAVEKETINSTLVLWGMKKGDYPKKPADSSYWEQITYNVIK